jgi:hypothetical protein
MISLIGHPLAERAHTAEISCATVAGVDPEFQMRVGRSVERVRVILSSTRLVTWDWSGQSGQGVAQKM